MKNILLIENQYLQFINIRDQLEKLKDGAIRKYSVFPERGQNGGADLKNYTDLTDVVRIALNPRYPAEICDEALNDLLEVIEKKSIDFLIIDYKLVGFDKAKNGINLIQELRRLGVTLPVLFFSQTSDDSSDVVQLTQDTFLQPFGWIAKSYTGHELLEDNYIEERVDKKISDLMERGSVEKLRLQLLSIITHSEMSAYLGTKIAFFQDNFTIIKEFTTKERDEITGFRPEIKNDKEKIAFIQTYEKLIRSFM